jgi:hypothetical protein
MLAIKPKPYELLFYFLTAFRERPVAEPERSSAAIERRPFFLVCEEEGGLINSLLSLMGSSGKVVFNGRQA